MKKNSGITLIALVITIIVMLILVGVSLSMTLGDNRIITQAQNAVGKHEKNVIYDIIVSAMTFGENGDLDVGKTKTNAKTTLDSLGNPTEPTDYGLEVVGKYGTYYYEITANGINILNMEEASDDDIVYASEKYILRKNGILTTYNWYDTGGVLEDLESNKLQEKIVLENVKHIINGGYILTRDGSLYDEDLNEKISKDIKVVFTAGYYDVFYISNDKKIKHYYNNETTELPGENIIGYMPISGYNKFLYQAGNKDVYYYEYSGQDSYSLKITNNPTIVKLLGSSKIYWESNNQYRIYDISNKQTYSLAERPSQIYNNGYYISENKILYKFDDSEFKYENVDKFYVDGTDLFIIRNGDLYEYITGSRNTYRDQGVPEGNEICLTNLSNWSIYNKKIKKIILNHKNVYAITEDGELHFWGIALERGDSIPGVMHENRFNQSVNILSEEVKYRMYINVPNNDGEGDPNIPYHSRDLSNWMEVIEGKQIVDVDYSYPYKRIIDNEGNVYEWSELIGRKNMLYYETVSNLDSTKLRWSKKTTYDEKNNYYSYIFKDFDEFKDEEFRVDEMEGLEHTNLDSYEVWIYSDGDTVMRGTFMKEDGVWKFLSYEEEIGEPQE